MSWLHSIRSWWRGPIEMGSQPIPESRPRGFRSEVAAERSSQQALSGYGSNPYDTYTWELHADPDGERSLKRTTDFNRKPGEADPFNPYDTGRFTGGW